MSKPKLLMMDEPSLGLAPIMREKLMDSIREISRRDITILIVEQDVCLALDLCDRAYVFQEDTISMEDSRDD